MAQVLTQSNTPTKELNHNKFIGDYNLMINMFLLKETDYKEEFLGIN